MSHRFERKEIPEGEISVLMTCEKCGRIAKKYSTGSRVYLWENGYWGGTSTKCELTIKNKFMTEIDKIDAILLHMRKVEENCVILGKKLIQQSEIGLGRSLIINGRTHDLSKLESDYEFEGLFPSSPMLIERQKEFADVLNHHRFFNTHHPEHWGTIQSMPELAIAEMVCDCAARSSEFGSDIREWFFTKATKIYKFEKDDAIGKSIKRFLDLLLTPKFERIN